MVNFQGAWNPGKCLMKGFERTSLFGNNVGGGISAWETLQSFPKGFGPRELSENVLVAKHLRENISSRRHQTPTSRRAYHKGAANVSRGTPDTLGAKRFSSASRTSARLDTTLRVLSGIKNKGSEDNLTARVNPF